VKNIRNSGWILFLFSGFLFWGILRTHSAAPFSSSVKPDPVVVSSKTTGEVFFEYHKKAVMTLHVSIWSDGNAPMQLKLEDKTTGKITGLSRLRVLRDRDFNLTPFLDAGHQYRIFTQGGTPHAPAPVVIKEFSLLQIPGIPQFLRLDAIFWVFLILWISSQAAFVWRGKPNFSDGADVLLLLIVAGAFSVRWTALGGSVGQSLEGDAVGYYSLVSQFNWRDPFATGIREPFYIWIQFIAGRLIGQTELTFRLVTVFFSTGAVFLTAHLARHLSGRKGIGLIASLLPAFGDFFIWNSIRGERSELYTFLLLLFFIGVIGVKSSNWKTESGLGLLTGIISLTWLIGLLSCVLAYLWRWARLQAKIPSAVLFLALAGIITGPMLLHHGRVSGDPLQVLNAHALYYKNAVETGVPSYEGTKTSLVGVLFKRGTGFGVNFVKGYFDLFLNPLNLFNKIFLGFHYTQNWSLFLFPFLILGLGWTLFHRQWAPFYLLFCTLNLSAAFQDVVRDPRLFLQAAFFLAYFFAVGISAFIHPVFAAVSNLRKN